MLLRDKNRLGRDLAEFEEQERDAKLAAMDPRNPISPSAIAPNGTDLATNPFDADFGEYYEDEIEYGLDFSMSHPEVNTTFAVLNSSLPEQLPEQHHLTSYASAKRTWPAKEKKQHRTKWHFGIRSRSPPMEVMLEIYRTLKTLGMEWKEKRDLGGLGGIHRDRARGERERARIERNRDYDGCGYVDMRAASAIYFIETRARYQDVVVLMNLQLYMVDSLNYLVDFHHKKTYKASTEPDAGPFEMANPDSWSDAASESGKSTKEKEDEVVSPFVFMDVACRLILELAGGGE
eukprot:GHVU01179935.1.p1 GENE.GHVU01179935.1~~GHVU01179935.1.p1  ORF type:complete len:291 (-),score=38.88 GHVU01179935.1:132-1004(-)